MPIKTIRYYRKFVYGTPYNYIINPQDAKLVSELVRSKTPRDSDLKVLTELTAGSLVFEQVIEPPKP